jgi:hypothetical protein
VPSAMGCAEWMQITSLWGGCGSVGGDGVVAVGARGVLGVGVAA